MVTIQEIIRSHQRIEKFIHWTPVLTSQSLNQFTGTEIYFKCENFQKSGAFKIRGATNAVEQLTIEELEKGELDIDRSLEIFEEGIKMSRVCSKKLEEAEGKIEQLTRDEKGELITELFPDKDENAKGEPD